ncbi:hydrophobe/amphiphile efflux-1 family RND transporter [Lysobacter oculi]|uniref:Efflux pump membrane transporter n=1 Tax=Solilutibacter oculi TaxID=2698682 RepID=A0A344J7A3_9GAMM|nr:efflux RND transporter permease subunit [Lysobacter oculi]AXA84913.1 hydrophobe/amphiphile efflux-1 family RND transporter [Lysobacter oculi]
MARFFIDRPIFAWVIAIILMLAGILTLRGLPVEQYPDIAPPQVSINAMYPGASAKVVEDSVTQVIEQSLQGLDGLMYMSSDSQSNGMASISLSFQSGTDPDTAQVQVQNKLQSVMPLLPQEVQRQGVTVNKASNGFLMVIGFVSKNGGMSGQDIGDYVASSVVERIARVPGVGGTQAFGTKYAMRIWLDPNKLDTYDLSVAEVTAALQAQNAQVAVGQLGGAPAVEGQQLNATISAQDRLQTPEQFRNIVVRGGSNGSMLRLGDVARVELGAESYGFTSRFNGQPASGMAVMLATGANALDTAAAVRAELEKIKPYFPEGLEAVIPFDTTPFVEVSIKGVISTLMEAVVLVFLVMYLFLGNFRATLIPTIAVPVVLLGTFAVLGVLGFTINMLTMFAMVLAIGLLVDDAIVVVENVERLMSEEGLSPKEAAKKSMDQITGALIGIGVVLAAVFVPMGFMGGSIGVIYRQFTATIVTAMAFSVLVAIVLTPALCATLLKPIAKGGHMEHGSGLIGRFLDWFNDKFNAGSARYQRGVRGILGRPARFMLIYLVLGVVAGLLFLRTPSGFLPEEDQGVLMTIIQAPVGATQQRTLESIKQVEQVFQDTAKDDMESIFTVQGFSFGGSGQNTGMGFVKLKDWSERTEKEQGVQAIAGRAMGGLMQIKDAMAFAMSPPAIQGLGTSSGFSFNLMDNGGLGHAALMDARNQFMGLASQSKLITGVRPNGQEDEPQLRLEIDQVKAQSLGLSIAEVNNTLATAWAGRYVDDFIDRGRVKRVYVQADAPYRMLPEDFNRWSVRNKAGEMVPFSAFGSSKWEYGSPRLERYNSVASLDIQGQAAPGVSSGDAMAEVERIVGELPEGVGIEWTGQSYQERAAGNQTAMLYALSLLVVFLALAALYESWSVPTAVLLVVPLGILGAVLSTLLRGLERDVYFQVAMLTTVGLSSKNAVLIIEFAKQYYESGTNLVEATMHAVRDRLRPIVMTSLAFGFGVLPMAIATGAGSGAQIAIGTGVLGGMIVGTSLGIFFIPLFYMVVTRLFSRRDRNKEAAALDLPATENPHE